jgi:hypothetical protein
MYLPLPVASAAGLGARPELGCEPVALVARVEAFALLLVGVPVFGSTYVCTYMCGTTIHRQQWGM